MTTVAVIEARMTSSRLPGKMAMPIGGTTMLELLIERLQRVGELDEVVLATTSNAADDVLAGLAKAAGAGVFRGSENDVLGRVCGALDAFDADICVEITGDCPLADPAMVSAMIAEFMRTRGTNAYVANTTGPVLGAPPGLDVQVFETSALRRIAAENGDDDAREHVSLPFYRDGENSSWAPRFIEFFPPALSKSVWISLDYREDYDLIRAVHESLVTGNPGYGAAEVIAACQARPDMTRACLALRGW